MKFPKSAGALHYCPKIQGMPGTLGTRANLSPETIMFPYRCVYYIPLKKKLEPIWINWMLVFWSDFFKRRSIEAKRESHKQNLKKCTMYLSTCPFLALSHNWEKIFLKELFHVTAIYLFNFHTFAFWMFFENPAQ